MNKPCLTDVRQIAFMPWLRLRRSFEVAGVTFVPWRTESVTISPEIADAEDTLKTILRGYLDRRGKPIDNCVLATLPDRGWNLADSDFEAVRSAAALLFLSAWSSNEYYRFPGHYVNASPFRVLRQSFSVPPERLTLVARRRDGSCDDGGYRHGEVTFGVPLQCTLGEPVEIDEDFLSALNTGLFAEKCATLDRLQRALPFTLLANTDDDLMAADAEVILMGSAFEQLFGIEGSAKAKAYGLCKEFGDLFKDYGSVTVEKARAVRSGIRIDDTNRERAAAQPRWWVHQKWMEELYKVRNESVHEGTAHGKTWGWDPAEHLVMAALAFPLVVKLLLHNEGYYNLSDEDHVRCQAVDMLLATTGWSEDAGNGSKWSRVMYESGRQRRRDRIVDHLSEPRK